MCKVFLYSRVSTSAQTLAQQERTVYEWLNAHNMKVDVIVSEEGVSGGVSYADRKLGKELLPMMHEGDALIVSEVSRLGRSMFDLSKLIHDELKPRKLRLIVVGMGIDLNCAKITPIDQLILSNFSFAAELEKHLIRERTLSALQVKRQQGVKFGAANEKYQANRAKKSKEQLREIEMKKGQLKNKRCLESRDSVAFLKAIHRVFPDHTTDEDFRNWEWGGIRLRCGYLEKMIDIMKDFRDMDSEGKVFQRWDFESPLLPKRLRAYLCSFKKSVMYSTNNN